MKTLDSTRKYNHQDLMGRRIAARLSDAADNLPNDISERLKAARMQALGKRKLIKLQVASSVNGNGGAGTLHVGEGDGNLWTRLGALIPLLALVAGLMAIAVVEDQQRADEMAEIDVELLADDLPPSAYTDPGFVHFLNANRHD